MKKHNPETPILMREAAGTLPRVYARYGTTLLNICICMENYTLIHNRTGLGQEKQEALTGTLQSPT